MSPFSFTLCVIPLFFFEQHFLFSSALGGQKYIRFLYESTFIRNVYVINIQGRNMLSLSDQEMPVRQEFLKVITVWNLNVILPQYLKVVVSGCLIYSLNTMFIYT